MAVRQDESDEELMVRVAQGDRRAFTQLAERYARRAHAVAQRLLWNSAEAADVVQDVLIKLWVHAPSWRQEKAKFSTWFYRVLTNACIDRKRKRQMLPLNEDMDWADDAANAEQTLGERQLSGQVKQAISQLPERQQVALTLCYYEEFSNAQAAEIMKVNVKALEALLVRARKALRGTLAYVKEQ